jgi:hypothetical protein
VRSILYTLDDSGHPVPVPNTPEDAIAWATWRRSHHAACVVAQDARGDYDVSTVFTGMDGGIEPEPLLWETIVCCAREDDDLHHASYQYASREAAVANHARLLATIEAIVARQEEPS